MTTKAFYLENPIASPDNLLGWKINHLNFVDTLRKLPDDSGNMSPKLKAVIPEYGLDHGGLCMFVLRMRVRWPHVANCLPLYILPGLISMVTGLFIRVISDHCSSYRGHHSPIRQADIPYEHVNPLCRWLRTSHCTELQLSLSYPFAPVFVLFLAYAAVRGHETQASFSTVWFESHP